ncbi:MAG: hypothetical protein UX12_C0031G0012 [Candidatus Collierbacteria bacterium GW2011_GWC1_45_47]|uniref:Uncharacterized protein n=2 Tax=Candidatus Collieribacteriota TaxID=1752725 RepID=A0A0G1HH77_9BACT|nr:MAG: hypothetical protein UW35_C0028G0022 [Candidatus Collierbacteria bacterium GW2011_GWF2_44_15]KKU08817.1 MAG: hypothetical protein UX12_C0031G0012 [Candidatus Collierbacteria bacterium GW2011_GWC1_45_47]KKU27464.1 MAG: hypothetical protein UX41_C0051G0012 [Candidatus Collierbacteria bacterium GW2011_GWE1_46_18]
MGDLDQDDARKKCPKCGSRYHFVYMKVNELGQLEYHCPDCDTVLGIKVSK